MAFDAMPEILQATDREVSESKSLFHYTNSNGLIGILKSNSLWATHSNFTNDSSECQIMSAVLKPQLIEETASLIPKLVAKGLLKASVLEVTDIVEKQCQAALNALTKAQRNIAPVYICSFCLHSEDEPAYNDGLLSQWRGYGNGFAIEFDELKIDRLAKMEADQYHYQGVLTDAVEYFDHKQRAKLERLSGLAAAVNRKLFETGSRTYNDIFGTHQFDDKIVRAYIEPLPFLKSSGFSEENEYRIAALADKIRSDDVPIGKRFKDVEFRSNPQTGTVVPYIELFKSLDEPLPIKSVLIGPHSNQDHQHESIEMLLKRFAPSAIVRRSGLTFRGL